MGNSFINRISIIFVLCLFSLFLTIPSKAWEEPKNTRKDANGNHFGMEVPNLWAISINSTYVHPTVKNLNIEFNINYPANTGNIELDKFFQTKLNEEYRSMLYDAISGNIEFCSEEPDISCAGYIIRKFEAYAPSEDIISVVYLVANAPPGASSLSSFYESFTFNLKESRELTLDDIFIDYQKALPLLWPLVAKGWCGHPQNEFKEFPGYYEIPENFQNCSNTASIPIPAMLKKSPHTFNNLGSAFLTQEGMTLRLEAWQTWGPRYETYDILIGKKELIRIGAKPEIWSSKR